MSTRTETAGHVEILNRLRWLIHAALIVVPLTLFSGQAVWAQTANPYVDKYERKDGTGSQPNATTPFSQRSVTRNTTGYRVESFQQNSTVQYMLVIGNTGGTGTSAAGATIADDVPSSSISNVSVPYILDQNWNPSSCATAAVNGNMVTATVSNALDVTGSLCRIIINGTATTVTPSLGVDNNVTLTAGAGGDSDTNNNHDGVRTIIFPEPTAATCGTNDVYALASSGGVLYKIDPTGTQLGLAAVGNFNVLDQFTQWGDPNYINAIGLTEAGIFYGANVGGMGASLNQHTVYNFDPPTQITTAYSSSAITTGAYLIAGSLRSDGIYFMSTSSYEIDDGSNTGMIRVFAFDTNTSTYIGEVARVIFTAPPSGYNWATLANGDNAFDAQGNLYLAGDTKMSPSASDPSISGVLYRVRGPIPSVSGTPTLNAELVSTFTGIYYPNGFAMSGDGKFYLNGLNGNSNSNDTHIIVNTYDVNTGTLLQSSALDNFDGRSMNDLASCSLPGTIELRKSVTARVDPSDDFKITMTSPGSYPTSWTAETGGTDTATTGSQVATIGTYTMAETGVDATDLASYAPEWQCVDTLSSSPTAVIASGSGASFTFTDPDPAGKAIVCTISNAPRTISAVMALAPTTTGPIMAGDTVQYTLTISNASDENVTNYTIYDIVPEGLTFVSASTSGALTTTCTPSTQDTLCAFQISSVPANGSIVITLTFTANTTLTMTDVVNQVIQPSMSCTADCTPTVPSTYGCGAVGSSCTTPPTSCTVDDPLCVSTPTAGTISTVKTLAPTTVYPIVAGATVTYKLTITNTNAAAVTNYTIDDIVPTGLTFASASGVANSDCTPGTENTLCSFQVASVPANGIAVVTLTFTVNTPLTLTTFYNQAIQPPADCTADCIPTVPPTYSCDDVGSACTTPPTSCTANDSTCVRTPTTTTAIPTLGQWGLLLLGLLLMMMGAARRGLTSRLF